MALPYDFAVVGAGIAGASIASELARKARVVLLEMEHIAGYHTTGRSAAMFAPSYGPAPIRALTRASSEFFYEPPEGFCEGPLLAPRGTLLIARADQMASLNALYEELKEEGEAIVLDAAALETAYPLLAPGYAAAAILDRSGSDIDVAKLHQGYLRATTQRGGTIALEHKVTEITRGADVWSLKTGAEVVEADTIVNASGAWAEELGRMVGAETVGLVPKRRTALTVPRPDGYQVGDYPLIVDIDEQFYLKPETGALLISPANEDPVAPCDVQPEEMDVAVCVDRIERAFNLDVRRVESSWAGLRSFVADKSPVIGFSKQAPKFFWLVGQGGYGIQSAPAAARLGAALATGADVPADIVATGLRVSDLAPDRPALAA